MLLADKTGTGESGKFILSSAYENKKKQDIE
jgi:hypothetical protein